MGFGDWLYLAGVGAVIALAGLVLWALGGKRPHYEWLERLQRTKLGPRQRVAMIIALLMLIAVMILIAVDTFTRPMAILK